MAAPAIIRKIPNTRNPWVATVNGKTYSYEAGTEQEVPAEIAHLIDQEMDHLKPKYQAAGGGSGSGTAVVHITMNDSYPWYSADKTFDEISAMIESGMNVMAVQGDVTEECSYMHLSLYIPGVMISFCCVHCFVENTNPEFGLAYAVFKPDSLHCGSEPIGN